MKLGRVLEPLQDLREQLLFVRGLYNEEALKGNIHSSQTGNLLSGAPLASGGEIRSGTSVDQLLAQKFGQSTKVPSLVLGCEKSNPSYTRIIRCFTVRTFLGLRRRLLLHWNCILHWHSIASLRTTHKQVTRAYSIQCCQMPATFVERSAPTINGNLTSIWTRFVMLNNVSSWPRERRAARLATNHR